jgi:NAD(P)-dependent dehydrogenase (short-subunit alcohol dehydrogenase family)
MSAEQGTDEPLVLRPGALGDDPGAVTTALTGAFAAARAALEAGRPVAVVVAAGDLLGQGAPLDAAVATGLLGMVRTLAIEGARPGWRVNVVAGAGIATDKGEAGGQDDPAVAETVAMLADSSLTGQLLQVGGANLGKLPA